MRMLLCENVECKNTYAFRASISPDGFCPACGRSCKEFETDEPDNLLIGDAPAWLLLCEKIVDEGSDAMRSARWYLDREIRKRGSDEG